MFHLGFWASLFVLIVIWSFLRDTADAAKHTKRLLEIEEEKLVNAKIEALHRRVGGMGMKELGMWLNANAARWLRETPPQWELDIHNVQMARFQKMCAERTPEDRKEDWIDNNVCPHFVTEAQVEQEIERLESANTEEDYAELDQIYGPGWRCIFGKPSKPCSCSAQFSV
jgi:hypothetical protein